VSAFAFRARHRIGSFRLDAAFDADGSVVALFGPSGSGKSTILRMIAGLERPEEGCIAIAGRIVFDSAAGIDLPPPKRRVGFVFQDGLLFPHLTVRQNLRYGVWMRRVAWASSDFDRIVDVLGIGHLLGRAPRTLSGGERQRVAIGRALLSDPAVLLMDEPVAAVDLERRAEILPFLEALTQRSTVPILYVSHAREEIRRLADSVVYLDDGRVSRVTGPDPDRRFPLSP
jgi:molybdate transport system ATP-binding protein